LTLALPTACSTSVNAIPRVASAFGSSWMRTAYFCEPNTWTCATPLIVEIRCARLFLGVIVNDGERLRFRRQRKVHDRQVGRIDLPLRRRRRQRRRELARRRGDRRLHVLGSSVDVALERKLDRDRCRAVVDTTSSNRCRDGGELLFSGVATDDAIVSGLAPGRLACTWIVGKSTFGSALTGNKR